MQDIQSKLKRVQPLIKAKQADLDRETAVLTEIRECKLKAISRLREFQAKYMNGVETLNRERQSGNFATLETLESGLDMVKSQWYQSLREVRTFEAQERAQLAQVHSAHVDLKSIEKLGERYFDQAADLEKKNEQKTNDELSVLRFRPE